MHEGAALEEDETLPIDRVQAGEVVAALRP
jgi:hypothetical protein